MAAGGGSPRWGCGPDMLPSDDGVALARSELTGEGVSTRGLGEKRDLVSDDILGLNSWVNLLPNSVLAGWEIVSDIDIGRRSSMCSHEDLVYGRMWRGKDR